MCSWTKVKRAPKKESVFLNRFFPAIPVDSECLGKTAKDHEPTIEQVFIAAEGQLKTDLKRFEAALFVLRKRSANLAAQQPGLPFYVCSLSPRVLNYKGMLTRELKHRCAMFTAKQDQTDSGIFDNFLEVLAISGRSMPEAVAMMMPPAWENAEESMDPKIRDYYKFQAALLEPWDGPALDSELKQSFAAPSPWGDWLKNESITMKTLLAAKKPATNITDDLRAPLLRSFGYTQDTS
eukprot:g10804.t1